MKQTTVSERALILAPRGRDASVAAQMVAEVGIPAAICPSLPALISELDRGAGFVIMTEEAIATADIQPLSAWIEDQEDWSDLPFVLLTGKGGGLEGNPAARRHLSLLGNATFLERPFHPVTLVSLAESALRARRRQYQARARLNALREGEARYRTLFESIESGFCIAEVNPGKDGGRIDYRIVEANPAFFGQTGFPETIVGQWLRDAAPDLEDFWFETYGRVADTGVPERFEQGSEHLGRWFDVFAFRIGEPHECRVGILFNDISARRNAEQGLQLLNETLEAQVAARSAERDRLWSLSQDMFARANFTGMMSDVSPAWTQILGWSARELLTREYATLMHPDDADATLAAIDTMAKTREPVRFENRIATSDGGWKHIEWNVTPEPDGVNFVAVGRDISHAKARETELQAAHEALRQSQKMEALGSLTGGVAHDFNNLLTPIIGSLDMLARRSVGNERERRLIEGALQSADRAKMLVQRLLAFARRQPLQATAVDIARMVDEMTGLIGSTLGPIIDVQVDLAADLPAANADLNQLEMALLNLAVNARDAMPDGGRLTISAGRESVGARHPAGLEAGDYIRLGVGDTGIGMDDETRDRAIEPFFSTKGIGQGTGLGLSMVHGLAAQLGGGLTIESEPGRGTTVALWLPISHEVVETDIKRGPIAFQNPVGRGTALLVDDEELIRLSTSDMLSDLGYDVIEADSAESALRLIRTGTVPDLLLTDHLMPGMNGSDLALAARELCPALPVLIVSGYAQVDSVAPNLPRLTKPFRKEELASSLAQLGSA